MLCCQETLPEKATLNKALIFISAISVHSFLEGLGCNLMLKNNNLRAYCIGMLGHKWIEAFVVGVSIGNAGFKRRTAFMLSVFYSVLTPVGILVGIVAMAVSKSVIVVAMLNGLSCGSFIYIGFLEMLVSEFREKSKNDRRKMAGVVTGFLVMTVLCGCVKDA